MDRAGVETELKLRVPVRVLRKLREHPAIVRRKHGRARTSKLFSIYFDTPDFRLARAGIAVRLRRDADDWVQTAKGNASIPSAAGLAQRVECEWGLGKSRTPPPLDHAKLATTPFADVIEKAMRDATLRTIFVTRFDRTTVPLRFADGTTATACIDMGTIHAAERSASSGPKCRIAELEIELASGSEACLFELARELAEDVPVQIETRSKAARGYALVAPAPDRATGAVALDYAEGASAGGAMASILRNGVQQIEMNAQTFAGTGDAEAVHQMRVGIRRTRCALALLRGIVDASTLGPLEETLRWLGGVLGEVRDLDVFETQTLVALQAEAARMHDNDPALDASIDELRALARAQAAAARGTASGAVSSRRYVRLMLDLGHLAATCATAATRADAGPLAAPARTFASGRLAHRHRKLRGAARGLETSSTAQRHALRVQAKKMRYVAEFFAPLFRRKRTREFIAALADLQRELGAANDATVAARTASRIAPGQVSSALVAGWTSARGSKPAKRVERLWRDVARSKRFWDKSPAAERADAASG